MLVLWMIKKKKEKMIAKSTGIYLSFLSKSMLLIFVILKLLNVVNWPWLWVLSPIWIPFTLLGIVYAYMIENGEVDIPTKNTIKQIRRRNK